MTNPHPIGDRSLPPGAVGHALTHYALTARHLRYFPPAGGTIECDCCVIGGGLAGLTTALSLARRGRSVVLLEAQRLCWAASGRNGGFVSPGFSASILALEDQLGLARSKALFGLSMEGVGLVRMLAREAADPGRILAGTGRLKLIRHGDIAGLERQCERMARDYGYPQTFLTRREVRERVASERYHAGLLDMHAFQIHPLEYASHVAMLGVAAGARLHENSRVDGIERQRGGGWVARTGDAVVAARDLVVATSAQQGPVRRVNASVLGVSTHVVTARAEGLGDAIRFGGAIADTRRASDYYRLVGPPIDPTLLWGGRITTRNREPARLAEIMRRDILDVFPQLRSLEIRQAWSGVMGYAVHKMPVIGRIDEGLWVATAFGGHGLNTSAMAAQLVSEAICDGSDRYRQFEPFGLRAIGGMFGRFAVQAEYWRLRIGDRIEEARAGQQG